MVVRKGHKRIYYEIYPYGLWVFYKMSAAEVFAVLDTALPQETPREEIKHCCIRVDKVMEAHTCMLSTGQTVICLSEYDGGLVAHEAFHATHFLMDKIGIRLSHKSDEAFAYMIGYIVSQIHEMFGELSKPKNK